MGFLIFAYRKLTLKRKINQDEFRQMTLSMEKQQVSSQISVMQQALADKQDMAQQMMSGLSQMLYAGVQGSIWQSQQNVGAAQAGLDKAIKDAQGGDSKKDVSGDANVKAAQEQIKLAQQNAASTQMSAMFEMNQKQTGLLAMNQQINSVFAAQDKGAMQALKSKETRIDTEMKSLESLLADERAEYQSVEKAESEEAKNAAPKFGLG